MGKKLVAIISLYFLFGKNNYPWTVLLLARARAFLPNWKAGNFYSLKLQEVRKKCRDGETFQQTFPPPLNPFFLRFKQWKRMLQKKIRRTKNKKEKEERRVVLCVDIPPPPPFIHSKNDTFLMTLVIFYVLPRAQAKSCPIIKESTYGVLLPKYQH